MGRSRLPSSITSRTAPFISLSAGERASLDAWARSRTLPHRQVLRAKIVLMAADCTANRDIAAALGLSRPTIQLWRERFLALRLAGLEKDAPRPGRKPRISPAKIEAVLEATLHAKPPNATQPRRPRRSTRI